MLENVLVLVLLHTHLALLHTHLCCNAQVTVLRTEKNPSYCDINKDTVELQCYVNTSKLLIIYIICEQYLLQNYWFVASDCTYGDIFITVLMRG